MSLQSPAFAALGLVLVLGSLAGAGLFFNAIRRQQVDARDAAYLTYSNERGYQYAPARPGEEKRYVGMLAFFNQGDSRLWQCEISGSLDGRPFTALEFVTYTGIRYKRISTFAIMRWERAGHDLPSFFLRPIDELTRDVSADAPRVEFDDDDIFKYAYALFAADPVALRTFFSAERRNAIRPLLQADAQQYLRASGPTLFWYHTQDLPPPEQMDAFITAGDRIAATLLDY